MRKCVLRIVCGKTQVHKHILTRRYPNCVAPCIFGGSGRPKGRQPLYSTQLWRCLARGLKTVSQTSLEDLPQGSLGASTDSKESEPKEYPVVVRQAKENMAKYRNCVLLTRVGGFYEVSCQNYN